MNRIPASRRQREGFLPDLCNAEATLTLILFAVLVAITLALARGELPGFWPDLGRLVLLAEFLTLASAAVLCLLRRYLLALPAAVAVFLAYFALMAVAALVGEGAYLVHSAYGAPGFGPWSYSGWMVRIVVAAAIVDALVLRYLYVRAKWRENVRREAESRLEALEARIEPHFLFNTLNTAAALVHANPEAAEHTLEDLAELFRHALTTRPAWVSLAEELEFARRYLAIEARRLGSRLQVDWCIAEGAEQVAIPPFLLQPLVENAVVHGIESRAGPGRVRIGAAPSGKRLELVVENPAGRDDNSGHGVGLAGVRARLALAWGDTAEIVVERKDAIFRVRILCPWRRMDADSDSRR